MKFTISNKTEFYEIISTIKDKGHWASGPLKLRWSYYRKVIEIIDNIKISQPDEVLEIGTVGLQVVPGSHTLDQGGNQWNYKNKSQTYTHDIKEIPWPLVKKYKVIVALRVWHYLATQQEAAFIEAKRLCDHLILVVPRQSRYKDGVQESYGITLQQFLTWNNSNPPNIFETTALGDLYYWNFNQK